MHNKNFVYYDSKPERIPHWQEGVVVPLSTAAKCAKFALDQTDHVVMAKRYEEKIRYVQVDLNRVDSLLKSIMQARHLNWVWKDQLDRVVIGRDMWYQVIDHFAERHIGFTVDMQLGYKGVNRIYGINVQVLPNMEGYLILPKFDPIYHAG